MRPRRRARPGAHFRLGAVPNWGRAWQPAGARGRRQPVVALPVSIGGVGVGGGRRGMGEAGGGDDPGGHAGAVGQLQPAEDFAGTASGTVVAPPGRDPDGAHVGLDAAGDGGHGAGRVGCLGIGVVGLAECGVGEGFPGQLVLLARVALALAFEDARGRHGGQAHAVTQEQDHVLRLAAHGAIAGCARRAAAVPPCRRSPVRMGHGLDRHGRYATGASAVQRRRACAAQDHGVHGQGGHEGGRDE